MPWRGRENQYPPDKFQSTGYTKNRLQHGGEKHGHSSFRYRHRAGWDPILTACFTTDLTAPPDRTVTILAMDEPADFRKEYKNYYLLYGILPVWTTEPEEIIAAEGLTSARVQTLDSVSDTVINLLTLLIVFPQTIVIEGNHPTAQDVSETVSGK